MGEWAIGGDKQVEGSRFGACLKITANLLDHGHG
jgi:hypothetical protein